MSNWSYHLYLNVDVRYCLFQLTTYRKANRFEEMNNNNASNDLNVKLKSLRLSVQDYNANIFKGK